MAPTTPTILQADQAHVWHPYAPLPSPTLVVASAEGVRLRLDDGRELVDGMSSWWAAIHGYRHPVLDRAITDQLGRMAHVMFGGLTHQPAVRLAEQLVELTPAPLQHVFFTDSGSVAVEVAIKMALQYWQARGQPGRARLLTVRGGYHGDTLGAMAVCDPIDGMHRLFEPVLATHLFADRPPAQYSADYVAALGSLVERHASELAGVIVEPVVQGAGGMRFYPPEYLRVLRQLCDQHGLLLILDEIATGFGRTGQLFGASHAGISPDLMCVGKALTGGYLTLAATLCTSEIAATISAAHGAFMHGPTFMANPLATAVASANLELIASGAWTDQVQGIERGLQAGLAELAALPQVAEVRVLGAIGVVELTGPVDVPAATAAAVAAGVWLRPFRNLIYAMPPYLCTELEISQICAGISAAVMATPLDAGPHPAPASSQTGTG